MNFEFSAQVSKVLRDSGWYHGRKVDIAHYLSAWRQAGYSPKGRVLEFTASFAGLKIVHDGYKIGISESVFDPLLALNTAAPARVKEDYSVWAGCHLTPVGVAYSEHMTYCMAENGALYGGFDDYFCIIGESAEEAFENVFFRKSFLQIS